MPISIIPMPGRSNVEQRKKDLQKIQNLLTDSQLSKAVVFFENPKVLNGLDNNFEMMQGAIDLLPS